MEKREPKDLTNYDKRFEEDPSSFNDFQAMDYVKELKNQGRTDDAIEVGKIMVMPFTINLLMLMKVKSKKKKIYFSQL